MSEKIQIESLREAIPEIRDGIMTAPAPDYSRRQLLPAEAWSLLAAELASGRASAARLQNLFHSAAATEHDRQVLAAEIFRSFTQAISILGLYEPAPAAAADESRCQDHSSACSDLDSGDSRRRPAHKDSGHGRKRRRMAEMRTIVEEKTEDGGAWRKYGQKAIKYAKHPRSYYRCTHKFDQGCNAAKQVQKMDDGSGKYKITYIAAHTCGLAPPIPAPNPPGLSASDSYNNICFSDPGNDQWGDSNVARFVWPESDDIAKGETTSMMDETGLWLEWKDFENLQETTTATTTNQYCFSMGDDADSHAFGMDFLNDFESI